MSGEFYWMDAFKSGATVGERENEMKWLKTNEMAFCMQLAFSIKTF